MIVAVLLGLLIGLTLGALGAGGSILAVPVLVYVVGLDVKVATATSLVAVGVAAMIATGRQRRKVRWGTVAVFVAAGAVGAFGGAAVGDRLDDDALLLAFSVLVLVAAHRMLTACPSCTRVGEVAALGDVQPDQPQRSRARTIVVTAMVGIAVGFLTGLFGVGGGFVIVPALTLALGFAMPAAIATSLAIVSGNAVVALLIRGPSSVDWGVALAFTIPMVIGSFAGATLAHRLPPKASLRAFSAVLIVVAIGNAIAVLV